ncbi:MAG: hypothetical protein JW837_10245 [Sedimentisphaerales bacterium]|nr:hypothetical protein [Sedimentisphaerales bacterium]
MWEEEKDFEILGEMEEYESNDDNEDDLTDSELDLPVDEDENENSDVFGYEGNFHYDEEDE